MKRRSSTKTKTKTTKKAKMGNAILQFLGATETVTGSKFLVETPQARVLVDCGLFQGRKELRLRNWAEFPVDPSSIDAVAVTHAHLDHSGYLPALVREGFSGPIFATANTSKLCRIVLPDSGHLQEEEAEYANRRGYSRHKPAKPLYTEEHAFDALKLFQHVRFGEPIEIASGVRATFQRAGHILGSSSVVLDLEQTRIGKIAFSGDLGRPYHPILSPPEPLPAVDMVLTESTYGDRTHEDEVSLGLFEEALRRTAERRGIAVIPSFAVDRTEVVLWHLRRLVGEGKIPDLPVYVDSPMALATLEVYRAALAQGSDEVKEDLRGHPSPFDPGRLIEAKSVEESMAINDEPGPAIIISASGMATGGRVLHHLRRLLPDPRNTVILVGFQAAGTRGRRLLEGEQTLKLLGSYVQVNADIVNVPAFSVHADQGEILDWLATAPKPPQVAFVVHGEPSESEALRARIAKDLHWNVAVPKNLERVRLS